jgi:hypothetical protein
MKNISALLIVLLLVACSAIPATQATLVSRHNIVSAPGEIITINHDPYPTLSEPSPLIIIVQAHAASSFNETLMITDEFHGLVDTSGQMMWLTGTVTETPRTISVGRLPQYTTDISWYPTIVGNHTLHITVGSFPEWDINMSVSFDGDGIITPSLGHPCIVSRDLSSQLQVSLAETRTIIDPPAQIVSAYLQPINASTAYPLDDLVAVHSSWVYTGAGSIQDELIVTYDISSIPNGFYDISVETAKQNYSWPHAVKIQASEPTDYKIVQLTDIHIGKYSNIANKRTILADLITSINTDLHPDFVILSGDSIDWYNEKYKRNPFDELKNILLTCDVPIFTTPGNHERFGNSLLFLYYPFINLTGYHRFLNPLSDYSFEYGGVNFVFLDSGYDYSRWEISPQFWNTTPEGSGLTNTQMYLLQTVWGTAAENQIITMHHPAVANRNDTSFGAVPNDLPSGNDECIAFNRGAFIDYCETHNVSIVLVGHTHKNRVLNNLGKTPVNETAWPIFIQTQSSTLSGKDNGGRIVHIQDGVVVSCDYVSFG